MKNPLHTILHGKEAQLLPVFGKKDQTAEPKTVEISLHRDSPAAETPPSEQEQPPEELERLERQIVEISSELKSQYRTMQQSFLEYQEGSFSRIRDLNNRVSRTAEIYQELDSLHAFLSESFDSLSSKISLLSKKLDELRSESNNSSEHTEARLLEMAGIHTEIISLRDFISDWFKASEENSGEIKRLSSRYDEHLEHLENVTSSLLQTVRSVKDSSPLSAEYLDQKMAHYEQLLKANTRRFRLYENVFYGVVVVQLILITAILLWWKISPPTAHFGL